MVAVPLKLGDHLAHTGARARYRDAARPLQNRHCDNFNFHFVYANVTLTVSLLFAPRVIILKTPIVMQLASVFLWERFVFCDLEFAHVYGERFQEMPLVMARGPRCAL